MNALDDAQNVHYNKQVALRGTIFVNAHTNNDRFPLVNCSKTICYVNVKDLQFDFLSSVLMSQAKFAL